MPPNSLRPPRLQATLHPLSPPYADLLAMLNALQRHYPSSQCIGLDDFTAGQFLQWQSQQILPASLQHSHPKRQTEFLAGRYCAQHALQQLGHPIQHLLARQTNGQVDWPIGYTGSISHHRGHAMAWVARNQDHQALALDVEGWLQPHQAVRLWPRLSTLTEMQLGEQLGYCPATWLTVIFSAKETLYKLLAHQTARVMPFLSATLISAQILPDRLQLGLQLSVDWTDLWVQGSTVEVIAYGSPHLLLTAAQLSSLPPDDL
ncbi:MAG: hypothetical protein VXW65_07530 [Pseudomonadota bacterium]|nr:hypothetical protein [Pseudomonadota bacterium]